MNKVIATKSSEITEYKQGDIFYNESSTFFELICLSPANWMAIHLGGGDAWMGLQPTPEEAVGSLTFWGRDVIIKLERE